VFAIFNLAPVFKKKADIDTDIVSLEQAYLEYPCCNTYMGKTHMVQCGHLHGLGMLPYLHCSLVWQEPD